MLFISFKFQVSSCADYNPEASCRHCSLVVLSNYCNTPNYKCKSGGDYLWESMQILFISNKTGGHKNHFLNSYLTGNQSSHVVQNSHSQAFRKQLEFWFITTLSNKNSSLNIQIITKAQDVGSTVQWIKALRPVALSLLGLDFPPQHLVGDQICLFHIGVSTAHHRTAREQRDGGEINRFKEQQNIQIYSRH